MSERRRLLMAQGEENNPWEKIDYLTFVPLEETLELRVTSACVVTYTYDEELDEEYENIRYCMFEYSLDDGRTWNEIWGQDIAIISVEKGQTLKIKANVGDFFAACAEEEFGELATMSFYSYAGKYAVAGTPMSLLDKDITYLLNLRLDYSYLSCCLSDIFFNESRLVKILNPKTFLPATRVGKGSYARMFSYCSSLVNAPELPATSIGDYCYQQMFYRCSSLINPPDLPSLELKDVCYNLMFYGCKSLIKAPKISATTAAYSCCEMMFEGCTSLVEAPELSMTTLDSRCCGRMFYGCSSLIYIKAMFTTAPSSSYTENWVRGVASTGTFVKNKNATWTNTFGSSAIPTGWTVITK